MAPKATLVVPLGVGVQTDIDPKLLPLGRLPAAENCVWNRTGELVKRPGNSALGTNYVTTLTPGAMPRPWQMTTHKGALVTLSDAGPRPIGVYSEQMNHWVPPRMSAADTVNGVNSKLRGQVLATREPVFRTNTQGPLQIGVKSTDKATDGEFDVVAWVIADDNLHTAQMVAHVVDADTGKTLFTYSTSVTYSGGSVRSTVRTVTTSDRFAVVWSDGTDIKYTYWSFANLAAGIGTVATPSTLVSDCSLAAIDAIADGSDFLVLYGATTKVNMIRKPPAIAATVTEIHAAGGGSIVPGVLTWSSDLAGSGKLAIANASSTGGVMVHWDVATGTAVASYTMVAYGGIAYATLSMHTTGTSSTGQFTVLFNNASGYLVIAQRLSGVISFRFWFNNNFGSLGGGGAVFLASKTLRHGTDYYAMFSYFSATQGSYFLIRVATDLNDAVDMNWTPSARFATAQATPYSGIKIPPSVIQLGADSYTTALAINVRLSQVGSVQTFDTGVDTIDVAFNPTNVGRAVEFADSLYVCGGMLTAFDGETYAEEGFHVYPEPPQLTAAAGGSMTLLGTYEYYAVFRYTDASGRIRRSAPSLVAEITLTGANASVAIVAKALTLHGRPGQVVIELYRNTNGQNDRHTLVAVVANPDLADSVALTDTMSDTNAAFGEELYTDGEPPTQPLEFQSPPPALAVATYKDRIAVIDAEDPTRVWVSLPLIEGQGPRFNSESTFRVDDAHGALTALAAVDDRLILFKPTAIYTVVGDGPDIDGNGSFGLATFVATGKGSDSPRLVAQGPTGVMFWSTSEKERICLVDRGLAVRNAGDAMHAYANLTAVDAVHIPEQALTKFFTTTGRTLVYDHEQSADGANVWTTHTGQMARCATVWGGRHVYQDYASSALQLLAEDTTGAVWYDALTDPDTPYDQYVLSPWLSLAALKGYARVQRFQGVGETAGRHLLQAALYANFDGTTPILEVEREMLSTDDWNAWELRYTTKRSAFQVGIRITTATGQSPTAGARISALSIIYLVKEGLRKIASGNRLT